ncbi:MAG: methylated-DNA--[protein]-cysteine S-methyltransferase [Betaproteobacteria bacterium]|nr:methylated-DNA--[protein]-cysteine S-methyltransferase [Betaproteobacteria bacterium]
MTRFARFATPLGSMLAIAQDAVLVALDFEDAKYAPAVDPAWVEDPAWSPLRDCAAQVAEYFAGERGRFDLPLAPRGTPFQRRVWQEIAKVPYGATITYAELAKRAGRPGSARAAGAATGRNPLAIVVPCHRIVATDGSLTGYAGGLRRKARLLGLEGARQELAA